MLCGNCGCLFSIIEHFDLVCGNCGGHEKFESAILRHTEEFKLLFPERKVTTSGIHEWCNIDLAKRTITRALKKNFNLVGSTSNTYFI